MNEIKVAISKNPNQNPSGPSEEKLNAALKDESQLTKGKALYAGKCASCHGQKGEGLIGPNLADKYWINGDGNISSIAKTISEGVPAKGMPPWAAIFTEPELTQIVAFVKSLKGTSPPNGKAPQGTEHE
jgi:cytochrome c oxidase cbb3-type subunit 3